MIYIFLYPDTTIKTASLVAAGAGRILNKTNTLINYGYGTPSEYMSEETGTLNKKGLNDLNYLYKNNQKFRDEIINLIGDKAGLSNDKILDKRFKSNTLNRLGKEPLAKLVCSKEYIMTLIELLATFKWELSKFGRL